MNVFGVSGKSVPAHKTVEYKKAHTTLDGFRITFIVRHIIIGNKPLIFIAILNRIIEFDTVSPINICFPTLIRKIYIKLVITICTGQQNSHSRVQAKMNR